MLAGWWALPLGCRSCDVMRISCRNATTASADTGFFKVFTATGAPCREPSSRERKKRGGNKPIKESDDKQLTLPKDE